MAAELPFQIVDGVGKVGVRGIGAHDPDGLHGAQAQAPGKYVRCISQFIHDCQDSGAGLLADVGVAVKDPGHGGDGDACPSGNVINIQVITSLLLCKRLQTDFIITIL